MTKQRTATIALPEKEATLNQAEYKSAILAAQTLRTALGNLLTNMTDTTMVSRLNDAMMRIIQTDKINPNGQRNVANGNLHYLEQFKFHARKYVNGVLFSSCITETDREMGRLHFAIRGFEPKILLDMPKGATHFKICSAGLSVDFGSRQFSTSIQQTPLLQCGIGCVEAFEHIHSLPANSPHPLLIVENIEFFQLVNRKLYPMISANALGIVRVSTIWE